MQRELRVVIFDKSDLSSELLAIYLKELDEVKDVQVFSDFVVGYESCINCLPDFAIVDISENSEFALDMVLKLSKANVPVIVTSTSNSSGVIIKALRAGASEFLTRPVIKSELINAVKKISEPFSDNEKNESKIITLFSGKGGSGKTTIAANLALELVKQTGRKAALIDLNFSFGELSSFLNLKPSFNMTTILENIERIPSSDIEKMFEQYKDTGLYLVSEPAGGENFTALTPTRIIRFLKALKDVFPYIIIDTPTIADEKIYKVLQSSDYVLFVTSVNLNSMKNSKKCIELLKLKGVKDERIKILLNRFVESEEHSAEEIELELGHKVYKRIPNNYFTVMSAINKGISVSEENINSNVSESLRELAVMLSDSIMNSSLKSLRGSYEYKRENSEQ